MYDRISVVETFDSIKKWGTNRATGPDGVHAQLLQAGGTPVAIMLNEVENKALEFEQFPYAWKGGRLVQLYKRKGATSECKSYRGLLVAD